MDSHSILFTTVTEDDPDALAALLADGAAADQRDEEGNTPLMKACEAGLDIRLAKILLERGANANAENIYSGTPLIFAVFYKRYDVIPLLIQRGAEVDIAGAPGKGMSHMTPLGNAVLDCSLDTVKLLIDAGAGINFPDGEGRTPLHLASPVPGNDADMLRMLEFLIELKADVNARGGGHNRTPLMEACRYPLTAAEPVKILLDAGADVKAADTEGNTALHFALARGMASVNHEIIKLLIDRGADPDAVNHEGITPFIITLKQNDNQTVKMLESVRSDISTQDSRGNTILHNAIIHRLDVDIIMRYINAGVNLKLKNNEGMTPLLLAVKSVLIEAARELVERGAEINAEDHDGNTALHYAVSSAAPDVAFISFLVDKGSDVNAGNNRGETPLLLSAGCGFRYLPVVKILLNNGADVNAEDREGRAPLIIAVDNIDEEIILLLLKAGADPYKTNRDGMNAVALAEALYQEAVEAAEKDDDFLKDVAEKRRDMLRILRERQT